MTMGWLKLHHDIIHDIKLRRFSSQEKWAWVVLLVLASESSDRGVITADDEDIADICEFNSAQDWLYFRDKLSAKGLVEPSIGGLKIVNWDKRQYTKPSDKPEAAKERKRRQRAKEKEVAEQMSRDVTPLSRHRSDPDTDQITDTDQIRGEILDAHEAEPEEVPPQSIEPEWIEAEFDPEPEPQPQPIEPVPAAANSIPVKPQGSGQGKIVPVFSGNEKEMSSIELLAQICPDRNSSDFRCLPSTVKNEYQFAPLKFYPWNKDEQTMRFFIEFQVNSMTGKLDKGEKRSIVETRIRKANQAVPLMSKGDYAGQMIEWKKFSENAQQSKTIEDVVGKKVSWVDNWFDQQIARKAEVSSYGA